MENTPGTDDVTNGISDRHRWDRILDALRSPPAALPFPGVAERACMSHSNLGAVRIVILERPSTDTVLISWSSSTACRYGEQTWRRVIAREDGVCILTGDSIARGDSVFRPKRTRNAMCSNSMAMIKASSIDLPRYRVGQTSARLVAEPKPSTPDRLGDRHADALSDLEPHLARLFSEA
ncbi:DUF3331 domain-containing protein [Burkholderia sp. SCN-KJ]|uniref:DUF3331 domain-containing protein n=1 Tax=Burkholderia sp. SCN-KJ TaxID=2969248 RepID=UPI00214F9D3E|nr:DUF3331 domain-containing protein [Burkholderia sp. SCN-KJ]MCR4468120.1 DUF3331 domain-containing protein [Burkholderia sp. SCN-KJ]